MELDEKTIQLYRRLNDLIPELQKLADGGIYSWSAIAEASNMDTDKQKELYDSIIAESEKIGAENVNRQWIKKIVKNLKSDKPIEKPSSSRVRRKSGTKIIRKCAQELHEVLDKESLIKKNEREDVINTLEELRESINKKIEELQRQI